MSLDLAGVYRWSANNHGLVMRALVLENGGTDKVIANRVHSGQWSEVHPGVYLIGPAPLSWNGRMRAATLAAGPLAVASHRAASILWGLDGIASAPLELTVPYGHSPVPYGVIVHRTRRSIEPRVVDGIPVTPVERTILDMAAVLSPVIIEQAYDSAVRRNLTTPTKVAICINEKGTFGVRGVWKLTRVLDERRPGRPTGSPAEALLLSHLRKEGIEEPERQVAVLLPDGTVAVIDLGWQRRWKGVEIDGLEAHASAQSLEEDLQRQNLLFDVGWQLRRFSARLIKRNPTYVVHQIARFLAA